MGGAVNQTTINNGVLQEFMARRLIPTIKGGRLIVEKDGIAVFAVIEKGGLLEVKATGDFKIFVTDTGASPAAGDNLTLVTTGAVMRHLRWAMPEALLISVRMNIPCWIMATIAGVSQRIAHKCPFNHGCAEYGGSTTAGI